MIGDTAICRDCSHSFYLRGTDLQNIVSGGGCPNCGGHQIYRTQIVPNHPDMEARDMVDPWTGDDTGGNPLQEGILGDWQNREKRDESFTTNIHKANGPSSDAGEIHILPSERSTNGKHRVMVIDHHGNSQWPTEYGPGEYGWDNPEAIVTPTEIIDQAHEYAHALDQNPSNGVANEYGLIPFYYPHNPEQQPLTPNHPDRQNLLQHPDPWMDNEPGTTTFPEHWNSKTAAAIEALPYERAGIHFGPSTELAHHGVTINGEQFQDPLDIAMRYSPMNPNWDRAPVILEHPDPNILAGAKQIVESGNAQQMHPYVYNAHREDVQPHPNGLSPDVVMGLGNLDAYINNSRVRATAQPGMPLDWNGEPVTVGAQSPEELGVAKRVLTEGSSNPAREYRMRQTSKVAEQKPQPYFNWLHEVPKGYGEGNHVLIRPNQGVIRCPECLGYGCANCGNTGKIIVQPHGEGSPYEHVTQQWPAMMPEERFDDGGDFGPYHEGKTGQTMEELMGLVPQESQANHVLNWTPGMHGRGLFIGPDLHTWNAYDPATVMQTHDTGIHHGAYPASIGIDPRHARWDTGIEIDPDGGVDPLSSRNVAEHIAADPRLYEKPSLWGFSNTRPINKRSMDTLDQEIYMPWTVKQADLIGDIGSGLGDAAGAVGSGIGDVGNFVGQNALPIALGAGAGALALTGVGDLGPAEAMAGAAADAAGTGAAEEAGGSTAATVLKGALNKGKGLITGPGKNFAQNLVKNKLKTGLGLGAAGVAGSGGGGGGNPAAGGSGGGGSGGQPFGFDTGALNEIGPNGQIYNPSGSGVTNPGLTTARVADYESPSSVSDIPGLQDGGFQYQDPHEFADQDTSPNFVNPNLDSSGMGSRQIRPPHPVVQEFYNKLPLLLHYYNSDESGRDDPDVLALHHKLEAAYPGYLAHAARGLHVIHHHHHAALPQPGQPGASGAQCPQCGGVTDAHGHCPQCGYTPPQQQPAAASGISPMPATGGGFQPTSNERVPEGDWSDEEYGRIADTLARAHLAGEHDRQLHPDCPICGEEFPHQSPYYRQAALDQGPQTDEQKAAVAELLEQTGRSKEIPLMLQQGYLYAKELSQVQHKLNKPPANVPPNEQIQPPVEQAPPGAGMPMPGMQSPQPPLSSIQAAIKRFSVDNIAPKCPKCGSHTTGVLNEDGESRCHACGNVWKSPVKADKIGKEAADNVAPRCPNCKSHTTATLNEDGECGCHACGHTWKAPLKADKVGRTSEEHEHEEHKNTINAPAADQLRPRDIEKEQDASGYWQDAGGQRLQTGQEYEMHSSKYPIPDIIRIESIKPDEITFTIQSQYGLNPRDQVTRQEAQIEHLSFKPYHGNASDATLEDTTKPTDDGNDQYVGPGQVTDLSTPPQSQYSHIEAAAEVGPEPSPKPGNHPAPPVFPQIIPESIPAPEREEEQKQLPPPSEPQEETKESTTHCSNCSSTDITSELHSPEVRHFDCYKCGHNWNVMEDDSITASSILPDETRAWVRDEDSGPIAHIGMERDLSGMSRNLHDIARTAGAKYSPREQKEFINEKGTARNRDRLDLTGTHYEARYKTRHDGHGNANEVDDNHLALGL